MPTPLEQLSSRIATRSAKIAIIGLGYVGLPTAVAFVRAGFHVFGVDNNGDKIRVLASGSSPIPDTVPHSEIAEALRTGRFESTSDARSACLKADVVLIIVPTPITAAKQPDLSFVKAAAEMAVGALHPGQLIVLESTTYPGTTEEFIVRPASKVRGLSLDNDYGIAYCPERINPGDPNHPITAVQRILGASSEAWAKVAQEFYGIINGGRVTIVRNIKTAEAAKVIENIQRDLNIALVNEFALIFERLGIDTHEVLDAAATKWNFVRYNPGPGVGGHCLPVDPYYLTSIAEQHGYHPRVILAGRAVNDSMPSHVVELLLRQLNDTGKPMRGSEVAVLGLAYKSNTGDARESPALAIVRALKDLGAHVRIADPFVPEEDAIALFGQPLVATKEAISGADAIVLITDHAEYRRLTPRDLTCAKPGAAVLDTRRSWAHMKLQDHGLGYKVLGGGA